MLLFLLTSLEFQFTLTLNASVGSQRVWEMNTHTHTHTHTHTPSSQVCLSISLHKSGRRDQCYRSAAVQCMCTCVCVCVCVCVCACACLHVCMCPCPSIIPFRKNERWRTAGPLCLSSHLAWTTLNNLLINLPKPQNNMLACLLTCVLVNKQCINNSLDISLFSCQHGFK